MITYRVPYSYWNKKVTALEVLGELLVQNIPSDPEDRRQIALVISDQIDDGSWSVRVETIRILRECLIRNIMSDPSEKRRNHFYDIRSVG